MNWEKLKPTHYFKDPVQYIYTHTAYDTKEYDKLYENQNDPNHKVWQDFDSKYKMGYEIKENFDDINFNKAVMCLWFFKERSQLHASYIEINGKKLAYLPNTILMTESKDIKFIETKKKYIRYPVVQLDVSLETWKSILKRFDKVS